MPAITVLPMPKVAGMARSYHMMQLPEDNSDQSDQSDQSN